MHASEQMQKFAPRAQSKTLENFRKITAAGARPGRDDERYLFSNFAGRLAMKAAMPSFWSAVANKE